MKPCTINYEKKQVIEKQLLAALDDKSKVAALLAESDLDLLILAMEAGMNGLPIQMRRLVKEMRADLIQLREAAFKKK